MSLRKEESKVILPIVRLIVLLATELVQVDTLEDNEL